jgi:glycosyltransferase involved in cell wall biosynthesis
MEITSFSMSGNRTFSVQMKEPAMPAVEASDRSAAGVSADACPRSEAAQPVMVVGVTHPQTCLVLTGRLRRLREAGFRVILVSSPGDLLYDTATSEGVEAVVLPMRREIAFWTDLISLIRLYRLLRRVKPDIVEFSTPKAGLLGSVAAALCGVPRRVYMLRGLKLETAVGFKRRVLWAAERVTARCAHLVLCNSQSLRSKAISLGLAPGRKLHLLGAGSSNGVDVERFSPGPSTMRPGLGLTPDDLVIGFVGRLTRDKGLPELVEAFEIIESIEPRARLLLVGWFDVAEDSLGPDLRDRIRRHPRIRLTGFVNDTADFYRAMDLMVLPTWREGFPNSVLEAAATGIPVITTHSTGSRDSVVPEVTGLLLPPGHPEAIVEAALKLLKHTERRRRMGQAARAWVLENYGSERVLAQTVDFYKSLLNRAAGPSQVPPA